MSTVSSKEGFRNTYPKSFPTIIASVGGLAVFLILASTILVSEPFGATVRGYFYGVDSSQKIDLDSSASTVDSKSHHIVNPFEGVEVNVTGPGDQEHENVSQNSSRNSEDSGRSGGKGVVSENERHKEHGDKNGLENSGQVESRSPAEKESHSGNQEVGPKSSPVESTFQSKDPSTKTGTQPVSNSKEPSPDARNMSQANVFDSSCDLYQGKWVYDTTGALYTNNSCPVLTQMQNCQGNGRPDKEYENWRWKPSKCDLPRFDPKKFLEIMRGKTLAFIGDSVARNQMESMLCILWQVEEPKNRGNKKMQRYYFRSTSTMIVRIWSSWLVHQTSEAFGSAPAGIVKLHLDKPDEVFMEYISEFDVVVLSSGHWFAKQSVYMLNNEIVGGQLWWPRKSVPMKIDNVAAFGVSVETILTSLATHPNYTGLTIVRSFSPDHYEGGAWNTGGSCTGKVKPALEGQLVENGFTNIMHEKQVTGFNRAMKNKSNKSSLKLLDITEMFSYRHDGHPGPYRSPDPHKITKRGPDGRPPPQDCLHWCMPGPVDTWNELVFEIIRRDFSDRQNSSS